MTDTHWCASCQTHRTDSKNHPCPVCADQAAKAAEARVAEFWARVVGA